MIGDIDMNKDKKNQPQHKKLTAAQRIDALENLVAHQSEQIAILADENDKNRSFIGSLARRINATIQVAENGSLTENAVNRLILDENVKELESKLQYLVERGVLERDLEGPVTEKSFVIGRDMSKDGNVVNPRIQFAVGSVGDHLKTQFLGKKLGDTVQNSEDETSFEITELYKVIDPRVNKKFDEEKTEEKETLPPEEAGSQSEAE